MTSREEEFERILYKSLMEKGLGIPTTMSEVSMREAEVESSFDDLPTYLQDPKEVFRQNRKFKLRLVRLEVDESDESAGIMHALRAARFGTEISDEVEERMKRDRERSSDTKD